MPRGWGRERTGRPGRASGLLFAYGRGHGLGCMQIVRSDLSAFWPTPSYHVVDTESPKVIKTVVGAGASWAKSSGLACSAHEVDIVCPELGVEIGARERTSVVLSTGKLPRPLKRLGRGALADGSGGWASQMQ